MLNQEYIATLIRNIPNFPKEGIMFKDITPVLKDASACKQIVQHFASVFGSSDYNLNAVLGIESRGFILGAAIAMELDISFIPVRKPGKLPYHTLREEYDLEYGADCLEMHIDAIGAGDRVLIHDDLLATGGTARACSNLAGRAGAEVKGFAFLVELDFLKGKEKLSTNAKIESIVNFTE